MQRAAAVGLPLPEVDLAEDLDVVPVISHRGVPPWTVSGSVSLAAASEVIRSIVTSACAQASIDARRSSGRPPRCGARMGRRGRGDAGG